MNIGMVLRELYPPDIRVDKELRMLAANGHRLFLLAYGADGRTGEEQRDDGVTVRYVQQYPGRWQRRLDNWRFAFSFRNALWEGEIARFCRDYQIEALHVHDLPLVTSAHQVARRLSLPLVADFHENYPWALQSYWQPSLRRTTLYNLSRWRRYELRACAQADRVICVIEETAERLVAAGVPHDKLVIVPNVSPPEFADSPLDPQILARTRDRYVVSYIGSISGHHRGLDVAIRAMATLRQHVPSALLLILGRAPDWLLAELQALMAAPDVAGSVEFLGWRPMAEVPSYIMASDVCLVPHSPDEQTHASGPHKLFQYMMLGRCVVVSDCRSLARIAHESGAAAVFRAGDPEDLARVLLELAQHPEKRQELGDSGRELTLEGAYSWSEAQRRLLGVYEQLAYAHSGRGRGVR
jgi:glycosyltransferase involved in cell wall biosynthesis